MLDSVHNLEIIQNPENILLIVVNVENKNLRYSKKVKTLPEIDDIYVKNGKIMLHSEYH